MVAPVRYGMGLPELKRQIRNRSSAGALSAEYGTIDARNYKFL